jgi:putative transposase
VGIDRGVAVSAALSTGELLHAPRPSPGRQRRLILLQRKLARAQRGSSRRTAVKLLIARLKAREADARKDWCEKASTGLARRFGTISVEDLNIVGMTQSARGTGRVQKVSPAYTSQRCSACGHVDRDSRESQARFRCTSCGYAANADVNAAINIAAGQAVTARGGDRDAGPAKREPQHHGLRVVS